MFDSWSGRQFISGDSPMAGLEIVVNSGLSSALSQTHPHKANAQEDERSGLRYRDYRDYRVAETEVIHAKETIVNVVRETTILLKARASPRPRKSGVTPFGFGNSRDPSDVSSEKASTVRESAPFI